MLSSDGKYYKTDVATPKTCSTSTFDDHKDVAKRGGNIAREASLRLEEETGKPFISPLNAKDYLQIENLAED